MIPTIRGIAAVSMLLLMGAAGSARAQTGAQAETLAQRLVRETVAQYSGQLESVELALVRDGRCTTVAATAPEDVGERCDADENGPMRTGQPNVEAPSRGDPVYDITQALHDARGTLIGAVGMDIKPRAGQDRAGVVHFAATVLREIEARIPSRQALLESDHAADSTER